MRLSHTLPTLVGAAHLALAASGHIYTYQPGSSPQLGSRDVLDATTARLVLAQRAMVEDWHYDGLENDQMLEVVNAINEHGIHRSLFRDQDLDATMVFLDAERIDESKLPSASHKLLIKDAPSGLGLFTDLFAQARGGSPSGLPEALPKNTILKGTNGVKFIVASDEDAVHRMFADARKDDGTITAFVTPNSHVDQSAWGAYEMLPYISKQLPENRKRQTIEEPLSEIDTIPDVQSASSPAFSFANQSAPLPGILPGCFRSQSSCESTTRNCTGHGSCYQKYTDPDKTKTGFSECWVCQCSASKSSDGKKTTYWGGSACQKKDISVEFWLIALFTVAMVSLVSFAVGSVWSMGNEELPSVIGAGVSGPPKR